MLKILYKPENIIIEQTNTHGYHGSELIPYEELIDNHERINFGIVVEEFGLEIPIERRIFDKIEEIENTNRFRYYWKDKGILNQRIEEIIPIVKRILEDKLYSKVELYPGCFFDYSERFANEVEKAIIYIEASFFVEASFYYFDSMDSSIELSKTDWKLDQLKNILTAGLVHYAHFTNIRKEIVSQIQRAVSVEEIDSILLEYDITL